MVLHPYHLSTSPPDSLMCIYPHATELGLFRFRNWARKPPLTTLILVSPFRFSLQHTTPPQLSNKNVCDRLT